MSSLSTIVSLPGWNAQPPIRGAPGLRLSTSGCSICDWAPISQSNPRTARSSSGDAPAAISARRFAAVHHTGLAYALKWTPSASRTRWPSSHATVRATIGWSGPRPAAGSAGRNSAVWIVLAFQLPSRLWKVASSASVRAANRRAISPLGGPGSFQSPRSRCAISVSAPLTIRIPE